MKQYPDTQSGFNLVELMIAVAIIGIITSIAVVSYRDNFLEANRSEGIKTLLAMQLEEEKHRSDNITYGTIAEVWGGATTTENGLYTLSISNLSATSYTLTAIAQGEQLGDAQDGTSCTTLSLAVNAGNETKSPAVCWAS